MNPNFDLDALKYVPAIRSRQAELLGYAELRPGTKSGLRPVIALGNLGQIADSDRVAKRVVAAVAGAFFLDLNAVAGQQCDEFNQLCDPSNEFSAWRTFAAGVEGAAPVALLRDDAPERAFVRQVLQIEEKHGVVALRSRRPAADLPLLRAAVSAVDDVNNVIVFLDFGYIRAAMDAKLIEASRVITALRNTDPEVRIAILSSSFPRALAAYGDEGGRLEILERDFHAGLGGDDVSIYGDHAAIYPEPYEASAARFVPRIDYALPDAWIFRRHRSDAGSYPQSAREIVAHSDWDTEFAASSWGAGVVQQQAASSQVLASFGTPAKWISVRVNMHIERQAASATELFESEDGDEDDGDDL